MSPNSEQVLNFLKSHYGQEYSKNKIAEELGISIPSVTGSINGLVKKGYVENTREEVVEIEPATETRKAKTKKVIYHTLTEAGLTYDPVAEEEAKAAEKAAKKAAKEAE
jgi:Mn-dependent DtxR family transcriptional regulator